MTDVQLQTLVDTVNAARASLEALQADLRVIAWMILAAACLLVGLCISRLWMLGKNQRSWL